MSLLPKMNRTLLGTSVAALGAGVCLAAIAQQPPREPPRQPDRTPERAMEAHTAIVVDLMSYIEKQKEHERRQREQRRRETPDRPGQPPRDPGVPPGDANMQDQPLQQTPQQQRTPQQRREAPQRDRREREIDRGIDWTAGDYTENLEAGVPMVLMIEDDSPWGPAEARPHVVAFDPDSSRSKEAFRSLKNSAGERVEVIGETHKETAIRGLRVLTVERVQ